MSVHLLVVEHRRDWPTHFPPAMVVTVQDYLATPEYQKLRDLRVINLCRSYRYLCLGYYCSLLAEARGHKVIPPVRTIQDLSSREIYSLDTEELDALAQRSLQGASRARPAHRLRDDDICFGHCDDEPAGPWPGRSSRPSGAPCSRCEFRLTGTWRIGAIRPCRSAPCRATRGDCSSARLEGYVSKRWRSPTGATRRATTWPSCTTRPRSCRRQRQQGAAALRPRRQEARASTSS